MQYNGNFYFNRKNHSTTCNIEQNNNIEIQTQNKKLINHYKKYLLSGSLEEDGIIFDLRNKKE